jgi:hypothetical protein
MGDKRVALPKRMAHKTKVEKVCPKWEYFQATKFQVPDEMKRK